MKYLDEQFFGPLFVKCTLLTLLFATGVCVQQSEAQGHDKDLKERFLREAPPLWEEYCRRSEKLQGNYFGRFVSGINNLEIRGETEFKANQAGRLLKRVVEESTNGKKDYSGELYCINPHYAFQLKRKSSGSAWVVAQLAILNNNSVPESITQAFDGHKEGMTFGVRVYGQSLTELIAKPYFRIVRCQTVHRDSEELVEVVFTSAHEVNQKIQDVIQGGTLVLDPKRFWCLRAYDLQGKTPVGRGTLKFWLDEPSIPAGSFPVGKGYNYLNDWKFDSPLGGHSGNEQESIGQLGGLREPGQLPGDEEFTLSAFGLPEPLGVSRSGPTRWYLWLGLGGGLCLLLGMAFRWLKKRAASVSAAR